MANYKSLSGSRVSFEITITQEDLDQSKKSALDFFRSQIAIKGFRKGHIPDQIVLQSINPQHVVVETASRALDKKYRIFIQENNLSPISSPKIENFNPTKLPCEVKVEVEVYPEVKLGDYKKIKIPPVKIEVTEKDIDEVIETMLAQQQKGKSVIRKAEKGDMVNVDFIGKDKKGNIIPKTEGKNIKVRLGLGHFIEDFEKALLGMKPGEEKKEATVKFPKDYSAKELAGEKVFFDITCHEVLEVSAKDLDESTIEALSGKKSTLEDFRKELKIVITQNKERTGKKKNIEEYQVNLSKLVKVDFPESWLEKESKTRMEQLKQAPEFRNDPEAFWKNTSQTEKDLEKMFRTQAEQDLKIFLGLSEVIKQEHIELNKDELERAKNIAQQKLSKDKNKKHLESELQRILLNLKIDKYLQTLTLENA